MPACVVLDLNVSSHRALGGVLYDARRYREAIEAFNRALTLIDMGAVPAGRGLAYCRGGVRGGGHSCATHPWIWYNSFCLAIVYTSSSAVRR